MTLMPDVLTHYYERSAGPFSNLSMLPPAQAEEILQEIRRNSNRFASQRAGDYMQKRLALEDKIRILFETKGGKPKLARPHYLILGTCPWLKEWYVDGQELQIRLLSIPKNCVSFTYGDSFPAMYYHDGKPYRDQVYTLGELSEVVRQYGLPQIWNPDGMAGPERYLEAQLWDDMPLKEYLDVRLHLVGPLAGS